MIAQLDRILILRNPLAPEVQTILNVLCRTERQTILDKLCQAKRAWTYLSKQYPVITRSQLAEEWSFMAEVPDEKWSGSRCRVTGGL